MAYVEAALIPVPNANKDAYTQMAEQMAQLAKQNGALAVMEAWGNDVPDGELTSMTKAVDLKGDEAVILSWIIWPDKATCEAGREAMMGDGVLTPHNAPFDMTRIIFGGFDPFVEA